MSQGQLWNIVSFVSPIVLLIGIIVGLLYFSQLNTTYRLITAYLSICLVMDILCRYLGAYSHLKYNLFMIPIFGFLELFIFSFLYYSKILRSNSKPLLLFIATMHLLILIEIVFALKSFHKESFQSYGKVIADAAILYFCLLYYWKVVKGQIPLDSEYNILTALIFIYYSVNLFIFLAVNFLVNEKISVVIFFWAVNLISLVLFYLALIYLIWQNGKIPKSLQ